MNPTLAIAYKEVLHILRDPRSLIVAIAMPLMMVMLYGYAIDMELRDLPVAILDQDHSPASRDLVEQMTSSGFIVAADRLEHRDEIERGFRRKNYKAALVIPAGYAKDISAHRNTRVQVLIDGADASTAQAVESYLSAVVAGINRDLLEQTTGRHAQLPIETRIRFFFNPELRSPDFVVPGLTAVILIMICALLTSIAVTREKETGTLEQILTAPVASRQVMVGKVLPYLVIAAVDAALVLIIGRIVFHVPMEGSWLVLTAYSLEYLMIALAFGLLISAIAKTQQIAMMMALLATLLPSLILSGFLFAIESMPVALRVIAHIIPATYYLRVIRGVMLAGRTWFPLEGGLMLLMAVGLMALAVRRFKSRLE
jgi:ABC-2 type transport system permease protein